MTKRRSQAERVAFTLTMDVVDVGDSEYQPGTHAVKVFTPSHAYYCSPNKGQKPPKGYAWRQCAEAYGLPVFIAQPEDC